MNPILRNILAFIAGAFVGGIVNMGIVMIGDTVIGGPAGVDLTNIDDLRENINSFGPKYFIFPFLAHALGTLVGAFVAVKLAVSSKLWLGIGIGVLFLIGGLTMVMQVGGPLWFSILDLVGAYIPMGWLGYKLAGGDQA